MEVKEEEATEGAEVDEEGVTKAAAATEVEEEATEMEEEAAEVEEGAALEEVITAAVADGEGTGKKRELPSVPRTLAETGTTTATLSPPPPFPKLAAAGTAAGTMAAAGTTAAAAGTAAAAAGTAAAARRRDSTC